MGNLNIYFLTHIVTISLSYVAFFLSFLAASLYLIQDNNLKNKHINTFVSRLPDLPALDKLNYKSIGLGFPVLTLAIISGFLWSRDIYGFFWGKNLRIIYSLVLWFLYALILHVRLSAKMRGRKVAQLSLFAFCIIIFTLLSSCR